MKWWHGESRNVRYEPREAEDGGRRHEIAEGIALWLPAVATFEHVDIDGRPYLVTMTLDLVTEGVRPTSVTVEAVEGSPHVTGTTLRAVKVWELASEAIRLGIGEPGEKSAWISEEHAERLRTQGPTPESLEWAAHFYRLGSVLGLPPAKQVELSLGLPRTTASKWVRRAREAGLIDG